MSTLKFVSVYVLFTRVSYERFSYEAAMFRNTKHRFSRRRTFRLSSAAIETAAIFGARYACNFSCTGITRYFFSFFFFFPIIIILLANFYQNSIIGFCFSRRVSFFSFRNNSFSKRFILFEFLLKSNRYCFS